MHVAVLGPLEVRTDESVPVMVPGAKERLLLAILTAGAPGVVSTDRIAETLWDGRPPPSARKSLQAHVVRLRSALEPGRARGSSGRYVVRRGPGYALAVDRDDVDWMRLSDAAARGRAQLSSADAAGAERTLASALELWRGDPYADWPDAPFAEAERRRLAEVRSTALSGLMEARLALGRHAEVVPDLERLVAEEPLRESWWQLLMLALYRTGRQADALTAARRARTLLAEELGADPGPALRAMESAVLAQDPALDLAQPPQPPADVPAAVGERCPYMGLAAYQAADASLFQGRGRLVSALVARLLDAPVVVVSGPSGAGKSSVVRAGLVPALTAGALSASRTWQPLVVTPGRAPVDVLAPLTGEDPPAAPVLLVCDQLEELWAPGIDPGERTAFLDTVLGLMDDGIVARCVAAVRGDHAGRLAEHAAFAERLGGALVLVPPLTDPELREIVREPARAVGLDVEPELVDAVVGDVLGRPGALPLLSTALVGTWERRRGTVLTLAGYLDAGGVSGALTRTAEAAYAALADDAQADARRLLVRLADVDDGGSLVRRSLPLAELNLEAAPRSWHSVVETFVERRLLSVDGDHVEVAHEALLTGWPRLARWLEDDAVGRDVRRHLVPAVRDWAARGRPDDELYRGARLAAALDWADGADAAPTPLEEEFLAASRDRADTELREAREQVASERRARRRARRLAAGLAAVLVVALVATVLAVRFQRDADARATEAERLSLLADANRLAALADAAGSLDASLLTATQAVRFASTPQAEDSLLRSLLAAQRLLSVVTVDRVPQTGVLGGAGTLFLGDGRVVTVVTVGAQTGPERRIGGWGGWEVADAAPAQDLMVGAGADIYGRAWVRLLAADGSGRSLAESGELPGRPLGVAFTSDAARVLLLTTLSEAAGGGPAAWGVTEFDVATGLRRDTGLTGPLPGSPQSLVADVSDDGRAAVVFDAATGGGPAVLVSLADGRTVSIATTERGVDGAGFRALGSGVAQLWADGAVTLFDADGRSFQQLDTGTEAVLDLVLSPDGTWGATVGAGGGIVLWDVDAATGRWRSRSSFVGHAGEVRVAEVSRDGQELITVGEDGRIVEWDVSPGGGFGTPTRLDGDRVLAGRPRVVDPGRLVVAPTRSGNDAGATGIAATFLDPRDGRIVAEVPVGELDLARFPTAVPSVAVSSDRTMVAITDGRATTVLDARTRERIGSTIPPPSDGADQSSASPVVVRCLGWTRDSAQLLIGTHRASPNDSLGFLVAVDPSTGEEVRRRPYPTERQLTVLSPDERWLAGSDLENGQVVLLDSVTLESQVYLVLGRTDEATDMAFSPDGGRLAVTGASGWVYVVDTGGPNPAPIQVDFVPQQVEWLPDGRTIAVAGSDGTVSLFDTVRGELRVPPMPASDDRRPAPVHLLPAPTDELVAVTGDGTGRRWPLEPTSWMELACAIVGHDFAPEQWEELLPDRPYERTCTDHE